MIVAAVLYFVYLNASIEVVQKKTLAKCDVVNIDVYQR